MVHEICFKQNDFRSNEEFYWFYQTLVSMINEDIEALKFVLSKEFALPEDNIMKKTEFLVTSLTKANNQIVYQLYNHSQNSLVLPDDFYKYIKKAVFVDYYRCSQELKVEFETVLKNYKHKNVWNSLSFEEVLNLDFETTSLGHFFTKNELSEIKKHIEQQQDFNIVHKSVLDENLIIGKTVNDDFKVMLQIHDKEKNKTKQMFVLNDEVACFSMDVYQRKNTAPFELILSL